jgi:N-acetylneuraminate synthase/sialic acid synthase
VALGDGIKQMYPSESSAMYKMGKKLVAARDLPAGHILTESDIAIKSPGNGLPPCEIDRLVARRLARDVALDENLTFELLDS